MSKQWKPNKSTVELESPRPSRIRREPAAPSRIRREPAPEARRLTRIDWNSREWEIRLAIGGIIFFALAITALVIDIGELLSH